MASSVKDLLSNLNTGEQRKLTEELDSLLLVHKQYVSHLLRTKHQSEYYKFNLNNLQPGECVVIVDYKMKLELGIHSPEIQRDRVFLFIVFWWWPKLEKRKKERR